MGDKGWIVLTVEKIRNVLKLKSMRFTIRQSISSFMFSGFGFGQGLGMSQAWGQLLANSRVLF
ncbi:hypothetical protein RINTHH_20420 [Richelia intracellularis HH01]|jgi:peptidoglycan hydrolase-like amidase|uniref:Uncharacterized protein n=1 Tax=Richelia intracellularis HH01 TaxID=1165094 RepID=M1X0C8_9NOST|nr:hypothetical protein RINTHH_20420 [Richelia intracellularis HH01]HAE05584.1 hypothetical protein [Richelia sp.]